MFQYKFRLGKRVNSDAIIANAYEHRSDVFSSIAALIGICAAIIGGKFGLDWLVYADPIAGLFVSLLVAKWHGVLGQKQFMQRLIMFFMRKMLFRLEKQYFK